MKPRSLLIIRAASRAAVLAAAAAACAFAPVTRTKGTMPPPSRRRAVVGRLGAMRSIAVTLLIGLLAGCDTSTAPAAVRPTLDQVEAMGYDCGQGVPDNVPSGLTEWRCPGSVAGNQATLGVLGNGDGVAGITLAVNSTDPAISRAEFRRLAAAVPPLSAQPAIGGALDGWTGAQDPKVVGDARVNALCDVTQCIVFINYVDDENQPFGPLAT